MAGRVARRRGASRVLRPAGFGWGRLYCQAVVVDTAGGRTAGAYHRLLLNST